MGVGGALMWPAILGMTYGLLPADKAGLAGGLILGVAGFGNAVGPMFGGFLTDVLSWRWVFFVNLPDRRVRDVRHLARGARDPRRRRPTAASTTGDRHPVDRDRRDSSRSRRRTDDGFTDPVIIVLFAPAQCCSSSSAFVERRQGDSALVPTDVLRNRVFAAACLTVLLMSAIFFSALLYLPQFMTKGLGYSAAEVGRRAAADDGHVRPDVVRRRPAVQPARCRTDRLRRRRVPRSGSSCSRSSTRTRDYVSLVPGMIVLGIGVGLFYSSITTAAVTALDPSRSSLAGGIVYMCQIAGGAIGLGLNTAIVASAASLTTGIATAFRVDAALAVAGFLVALLFVGGSATTNDAAATSTKHHRFHRAHA